MLVSKQKQNKQMGSSSESDTTHTKIFVGGLAWSTQRGSIRRYFEQFGEIAEAVVISDKRTGRSRGYGFVTFKDPDSAVKACINPWPVIDGRRTNCNLAAFGAQKRFGGLRASPPTIMTQGSNSLGISTYLCQNIPEFYLFPYSTYGFPCYYQSQDMLYMNYHNVYSGSPNNEAYSSYYPLLATRGESVKTTENPSKAHSSQSYEVSVVRPDTDIKDC